MLDNHLGLQHMQDDQTDAQQPWEEQLMVLMALWSLLNDDKGQRLGIVSMSTTVSVCVYYPGL